MKSRRKVEKLMYIHMNGALVPKEKAQISPFDHGYLYGVGLFETLRVYNRHPFLLADHVDRLNNGLEKIGIKAQYSIDEWHRYIIELLDRNGYDDAYIRMNVSAGYAELGLSAEEYLEPTTIIFSKPLPMSTDFPEKKACILKTKRNTPETGVRLKSIHFLNNVIAKQELGHDPTQEGIFLNEQGYLAEGIVSNLFWVKEHIVYTPSVDIGILNGVTRQFICSLLKKKNIELRVGYFQPEQLMTADEAFMTNSIQEIVPLYAIDDYQHFPGNNGEMTKLLLNEYKKYRTHLISRKQL